MPKKALKPIVQDHIDRSKFIANLKMQIEKYLTSPKLFENNIFLIDGKWGSGKTWTINALQKQIDNKYEWQEYSAWQYFDEKELFYDFWLSLKYRDLTLGNADEQVENVVEKIEGVKKFAEALGDVADFTSKKMIDPLVEYLVNLGDSCQSNPFMNFGIEKIPILKDIAKIAKTIASLKKESNISEGLEKIEKAITELTEAQSKDGFIYTKSKPFDKLDNIKPTIVIIDDLDRVHEDKLWRIFTLLSLFERKPNILFILVGSSEYLTAILDQKYHVKGEAENFLTKFIGREFKLPEPDYLQLVKDLYWKKIGDVINAPTHDRSQDAPYLDNLFSVNSYRELKLNFIDIILDLDIEDFMKHTGDLPPSILSQRGYEEYMLEAEKLRQCLFFVIQLKN